MTTPDKQIAMKHWCGEIQYPGLTSCWAGTLFIEASAKDEEVREAFIKKVETFLPTGFKVLKLHAGQIWFVPAGPNV